MSTPPLSASKARALAVVAIFVAACSAPLLAEIFGLGSDPSSENRILAEKPRLQFTARGLRDYPGRYESYYADNFGLRRQLLHGYARLRYFGLGLSSTDRVVVGKQGWLFVTLQKSLEDRRGLIPFTPGDLENWARLLEEKQAWAEEHGARYALVIPPSKHTIYPEYFADGPPPVGPTRLEQLVAYLERIHSPVTVIDLREPLLAAKREHLVYYATDSHWTEVGALVGAEAILARLRLQTPELAPLSASEFTLSRADSPTGGDLAGLLGLAEDLPEPRYSVSPKQRCAALEPAFPAEAGPQRPPYQLSVFTCPGGGQGSKLLLYGDSFSIALSPILAERFERTVYVRGYQIFPEFLPRERPQWVLEEMTERFLVEGRANPPEMAEALARRRHPAVAAPTP